MSTENTEPVPVPPPATEAPAPQLEPQPAAEPAPEPVAAAASEPVAASEPAPAVTEEAKESKPEEPKENAKEEAKEEAKDEAKPAEAAAAAAPETVAPAPEKAATEEPQNLFTQKFTDAEWKAVKELRSKLPEIFSKAYPKSEITSVTLWGVPLSTEPNAKASVVLAKFLRARDLDVARAAEMLVSTLKWRDEFKIDEVMSEEFDQDVFGRLGKVYGKDKEGRPVIWNLYGAVKDMKAVFGDIQKFIRWRVQFMEESIKLLDFETVDQMVQIHDYEGVSMTQRDANQKAAAKEATTIFQEHYPEFLSRKFFINVPTLLTWIFWLFKPLISANTLAKMSVVGTGAKAIGAELSQVIDKKELPKRYGGEAEGFD